MASDEPEGRKGRSRRPRASAPDAGRAAQAVRARSEFILSRAAGLLLKPETEWTQIRDEPTTARALLAGYVAPLAAIPPLFGLIGQAAFGERIGAFVVRREPAQALISALVDFALSVALIYFLGLLINALADQFEADKDELKALKVSAYAATPAFLSGVFALWPQIWWLGLVGVGLSAYLLLKGLPILMKTPADRALGYATTAMIAALVASVLAFIVTGFLTGLG